MMVILSIHIQVNISEVMVLISSQLSSVIQTEMTEIPVAKTSQSIKVYAVPEKAVPSLINISLCSCAQVKSLTTR